MSQFSVDSDSLNGAASCLDRAVSELAKQSIPAAADPGVCGFPVLTRALEQFLTVVEQRHEALVEQAGEVAEQSITESASTAGMKGVG